MNEEKIMKKHILLFIMILIPIFAQKSKMQILESKQFISSEPIVSELQTNSVPRKISYQGILTKDNGNPADESFYNVTFRLYEVLEGGTPFWEESQLIFIKDGFLTATIGVSNELSYIPPAAFLEVEVGSSVLEPRQEMTSVFYSILSDTAYYAKGYTKTEDLSSVALSGKYEDLLNIPDTVSADLFIGSASGLTGILADSVGVLSGNSPLVFDGELADDNQISLKIEEPINNTEIILPNTSGTIITTGNDQLIDEVGVINSGIWMGESIEDLFIDNDLDILGGVIDNTPIGDSIPSSARFTIITTQNGLNINDGEILLSNDELGVLDSALPGQSLGGKAIITNEDNDISGLRNINSTGVINAESFAGMFMGDGSGITGVSASSIKSDDITAGDAAVTISTSTGAINLTPATGSAVVLDGSVNVDGGAVTGLTSLTVSGEASVTTLDIGGTNVTTTAAELNVLDGALKETNSIWIGSDPSSTTDAAEYNVAVGSEALDAVTTGDSNTALGYNALTANLAGNRNTAVGTNALKSNTTGITNVAIGSSALEANTTANSNTAVGHASSFKLSTGQNNVTLGYESSKNMTNANDNVIIGSGANPSADTGTANQIVLGKDATGQADNSVVLGNADVTAVYMAQDKGATVHAAGADLSGSTGLILENDEPITNSTDGPVVSNGTVAGGTGRGAGVFTSNGDQDVTLQTGNSTTGSITITDGANGNIALSPNGSGAVQLDGLSWPTADGSANQVLKTDGSGALSWSTPSTSSATVTVTDNENTNEGNALIFAADADLDGGTIGLESDGDATYNPSTGTIAATNFSGNLTGTLQTAAQPNVTSVGTLGSVDIDGGAVDGAAIGANSASTGAFTTLAASGATDLNSTLNTSGTVSLDGSANELRFYEGSNYVGFEAPSLSGDQIWVLPTADGSSGQMLKTDGSGNLGFVNVTTLVTEGIDWQSTVKTGDFTAVSGEGYFVNTTSGAITATLPASPSAGAIVAFKDYAATFATNNLTVGRNSSNIQGNANDSLLSTNRASVVLVYVDATKGWLYVQESNVSDFGPSYISATGGTITTSGDYKIHTFTSRGNFAE